MIATQWWRAATGVLGNFMGTPGAVCGPNQWATLAELDLPKVERQTTLAEPCLPLSGVTVVESAAIIASPFGASMLADLGAQVMLNLWIAILSESWPSVWARLGVIPIRSLAIISSLLRPAHTSNH